MKLSAHRSPVRIDAAEPEREHARAPAVECYGAIARTLAELRENKPLRKVKFLKNTRLTISPLTEEEYTEVLRMAGLVASPGIPLP